MLCHQTSITIQAPNDAWAAGSYIVALTLDGTPAQCSLQIPDPSPVGGVQGSCGANAALTFRLITVDSCLPVACSGSNGTPCKSMGGCAPIPGRFRMVLGIGAMPAKLGLDLSVDGNALMNETIAPMQTTTEPNGAGCGTCTNASATLSIAGG